MFQRILVPVDRTAGSENAIPYAKGLAQTLDAEVVICHVITAPVAANSSSEERDAAQYVSKIAQRFRASGVTASTQVRMGDAPLEINKAVVESSADALFMATRSRRRLEKLMLGSVADIVVRDSSVPVLLISSRQRHLVPPIYTARRLRTQVILVPVDGTARSETVVPYALGLAKALGAEAIVCHVITTPVAANTSGDRRHAARYVAEIAQRFRTAGVAARTQICKGDPPAEINKGAADWNVDAIVMATRSRRRLEKLVLGSVADAVVRDCRLPVLLVSSRRRSSRASLRAA